MTLTASPATAEPMSRVAGTARPTPPVVALLRRMLTASVLAGHAAWVLAIVLGLVLSGRLGALNAAVGGAVVVFFYAAGQGLQLLASVLDPRQGMALTVTSFVTRAGLLGLLLLGVQNAPRLEDLFRPLAFCVGVALVLVGWLGGMFWSWSHTRVPSYDQHWDPRPLPPRRTPRQARDEG